MLTAPNEINHLKANEVFVFGSNEAGRHGKGAALIAKKQFGAKVGQGYGVQGSCFAIPTKNGKLETLKLTTIAAYVNKFIAYANTHPEKDFLVTRIGCGLAGYKETEIAPLFKDAVDSKNIFLPITFTKILGTL